jgi:V-type H+-transporting ATPase subunit H
MSKEKKDKKHKRVKKPTYNHLSLLEQDFNIFFEHDEDNKTQEEVTMEKPEWSTCSLSSKEIKLIDSLLNEDSDKIQILDDNAEQACKILLKCLGSVNDNSALYFVVNMIFSTLLEYPEMVRCYESLYNEDKTPVSTILTVLRRKSDDFFVVSKLFSSLTFIIMNTDPVESDDIDSIFQWCTDSLEATNTTNRIKLVILTNIGVLIKRREHRVYFEEHRRILKMLIFLTSYKPHEINEQILYQTLNCLWILTFNEKVQKKLNKANFVRNLCQILSVVTKDKIIRLTVAVLRNILHEGENGEVMIGNGIMESIKVLKTKKEQFDDEDFVEDLTYLEKHLEPIMNKMSSFDRFKHEVLSGKLDPSSPTHKSERFWRENCTRFEENKYEVLKALGEIIEAQKADAKILATACWDMGEFVHFHPRGKAIVEEINCKLPLMKCLVHDSEKVKGEALLALQKLMVTNWEYLQQ